HVRWTGLAFSYRSTHPRKCHRRRMPPKREKAPRVCGEHGAVSGDGLTVGDHPRMRGEHTERPAALPARSADFIHFPHLRPEATGSRREAARTSRYAVFRGGPRPPSTPGYLAPPGATGTPQRLLLRPPHR